jgi:hypothetical protein
MTTPLLQTALEPIVARHRQLRFLGWLAIAFTICAVLGWFLLSSKFLLVTCATAAAWFSWRYATAWQPDYGSLAREIEQKHPRLQHLLQTAVEQEPSAPSGKLSYLQMRVVAEAVGVCRQSEILHGVSTGRLAGAWVAFVLASAFLLTAFTSGRTQSPVRKAAVAFEDRDEVEVSPGDVTIERGSGLVVLAKFPTTQVPTEARMVVKATEGAEQRSPMVKNFEDPVFGGGVPEVNHSMTYRVEYGGKATREFKVVVYEHPRLDRADAHLRFPEYTKLPEKQIADTRRVSAVEGSTLDVEFQLNKAVRKASLVSKSGTEVPLVVEAGKAIARLKSFTVAETATYEVKLEDEDGRGSKVPAQFTIEAKQNRKPELKFLAPRGDIRVSPIEEVGFRVEAWDDFGLIRAGLQYTVAASGEVKEIILAENSAADARITAEHLLQLEALKLQPDELISWFAWAEDIGPDGQPRRTASDMYFAEVRPFEEIFRQGDSAEAEAQRQRQQSPAGNQATKLAQLQKQIMSATWNLQRAESGSDAVSEKYKKDVPVIQESQADALKQAEELAEKVEDPKSRGFAEAATGEMQTAIDKLTAAAETAKPLPDALKAEQSAYNALLKLASHEYNVTRRQRSSSSNGEQSSQGMQQQLDELELKAEEKRYETQREAASPEEQEQREQLAVLNRLKELAQRQQDINEKVKELQAALQEEKTEKEKEELRRELKRLREEQQQMLADLDELSSKMGEEKNQARFAEERQKVEQTRNEAQQASEAMQRGEASQALASGARAQQDLQEMRDDLRRKTSKRFTEEMRNMRSDARDLADRQKEVSEALSTAAAKPERKTLDGSSEKDKTAKQLEQQKEQLQKLTEEMKRVSEQAEVSEPLLSTELYDTLRRSTQADTARALDMTQQLTQRGFAEQAQKFEEKARGEIDAIRDGVERAAEKVLGDEAEALRKARADLDRLAQQLDKEMKGRTGESSTEEPPAEGLTAQAGNGSEKNQPGQSAAEQQANAAENGPEQASNTQAGGKKPGESEQGAKQPSKQGGTGEAESESGERKLAGTKGTGQQQRGAAGQAGEALDQREGENERADGQPNSNSQGGAPSKEGRGENGERTADARQHGSGQRAGQRQGGEQPGGRQPGEGPGAEPAQGETPSQSGAQTAQNNRPGQGRGDQPGGQRPGGQQGSGQRPGEQQAQGASGGGGGRSSQEPRGDEPRELREGQQGSASHLSEIANAPRERGGTRQGGGNGGPWGGGAENVEKAGPLTGDSFVQWSDQLRTVEEMLEDPTLRAEAARIREAAKGMRAEFKRHSVEPKWDIVRSQIRAPLAQLRDRVGEELARREKQDALVPIDRDPVPTKFAEQVRKYYENLGRSTP